MKYYIFILLSLPYFNFFAQYDNFDRLMINHSTDLKLYSKFVKSLSPEDKLYLNAIKKTFQNFETLKNNFNSSPKIPKIIHQIWVGPKMPDKLKKMCETWKKFHPKEKGWKYILWDEKKIKKLSLVNQKYIQEKLKEKDFRAVSNILRYEVVNQYGGFYIDTDFLCLKPFDELLLCDFFTGMLEVFRLESHKFCGNAIIGATPGHEILKILVENIKNYREESTRLKRTGPVYFSRMLKQNLFNCSGINVIFPNHFFYPWYKINSTRLVSQKESTYAIHYYFSNNLHNLAEL